ncbi:hypothetical protein, variant 1 [Aphanomyces astaci]|uniref:GPI mannosyltransferase 2 n=1 Tax=Aphanomyces astaci TaxID=112090 RepID=W4G0G8_APHAT|nr:hypothetical protein, variant 1 [Aphanomyces astaci]ETV72781.1 hypothetical protein, variant 1 [Aphanomyces astaci]|eukprot:XP_009837567.1 hypothetical protein, variant 1 [Aphanomyces astaci]
MGVCHGIAHSKSIFSAFAAWDGVYFVDIAGEGYRYENTHAFFPLFPLLVRWTSPLLLPVLDKNTSLLAAGWLISNVCFVLAAVYLYRLGLLLLNNESLAKRAAYFFCICPSGIFMSACYSESLMCVLSFSGMYCLERYRTAARSTSGHIYLSLSALLFGLSAATRSNGILHSLYIAYYRLLTSPHPLRAFPRFFGYWTYTALLGVVAIGFQVAYFVVGVAAYCPSFAAVIQPLRSVMDMPMTSALTQDRPWCSQVLPNYSAMYLFIQREYWGVGPFAYYQLKQIPNFVLAGPMIALAAYAVYVGCISPKILSFSAARPYFVHVAFLLANALVVVHIQVITRFLAASPPIFWAAAFVTTPDPKQPANSQVQSAVVVTHGLVLYFLVFNVVGATLFPSFYPWT